MDTRDKRASVLGLGLAALLILPEPGSIDQPDRQHLAYSYRGIEAAAIVIDYIELPTGTADWRGLPTGTAVYQNAFTGTADHHAPPRGTAQWGD